MRDGAAHRRRADQKKFRRHIEVDGHRQMILSREDLDVIREKRTGMGADKVGEEFRFFDATRPGSADNR